MKNFNFNGKHLMVDAITKKPNILANASLGSSVLESIVERIDMTMILPPVTVKFPHNICEQQRILESLIKEGLADSQTAEEIETNLRLRKAESYGYSSFVMIAESHISLHTFPELGYFSFDCYSCKNFDEIVVLETIREHIETKYEVSQLCGRFPPKVIGGKIDLTNFSNNRKIITREV